MDKLPDYVGLLRLLSEAEIKFVAIGGVAMMLHGANYFTVDVDVCVERSPDNAERICRALKPYSEQVRGAFTDMVYFFTTITRGESFRTEFGQVDFLGEVSGIGDYGAVLNYSTVIELEGFEMRIITLEGLIKAKEAANRPKDQQHLITLRALREIEDKEENGLA
jgi:predicted nucleotidyltransferase